jgi:hypothetical protein
MVKRDRHHLVLLVNDLMLGSAVGRPNIIAEQGLALALPETNILPVASSLQSVEPSI